VTEALEGFDALAATHALEVLVDDVSNWYVRLSRSRFWKAADGDAHATLHETLATVAKLLAPFCPFLSDELFVQLALGASDSVHLEDWPAADTNAVDRELEAEMALGRQFVALGRAARADAKVKTRQPLPRALLLSPRGERLGDEVAALVRQELNVKALEVVDSLEGLVRYTVVPNFKALGPRLGPQLPAVKEALATVDGSEVQRALDADGRYVLDVNGNEVVLEKDDVEVRAQDHEEFVLAQDGPYAVALDLAVTDELRLEGLARELIRALNDLRKTSGLAIADRIRVTLSATGLMADAVRRHADWVGDEVLAVSFDVASEAPTGGNELTIEGCTVTAAIQKA